MTSPSAVALSPDPGPPKPRPQPGTLKRATCALVSESHIKTVPSNHLIAKRKPALHKANSHVAHSCN